MTTLPDPARDEELRLARQARLSAIVMIATFVLWMLLQALGGFYGWPVRLALLFDLAAMAAFIWALIVATRVWHTRRKQTR